MKRFNADEIRVNRGYLQYKGKPCHRIIWEQDIGPIPPGHDIHHKDGNTFNNLLENLECLTKSDHIRLHANDNREKRSACMKSNSEKVHAWLKTRKGKKFLSDKFKKQWEEMEFKTFTCEHCKKEFQTKHNRHVKFCGDNCVMAARRITGIDNEERACIICSNPFVVNRYQKTKTCSKACRAAYIGKLKTKKIS